jgi:hypothetical protein
MRRATTSAADQHARYAGSTANPARDLAPRSHRAESVRLPGPRRTRRLNHPAPFVSPHEQSPRRLGRRRAARPAQARVSLSSPWATAVRLRIRVNARGRRSRRFTAGSSQVAHSRARGAGSRSVHARRCGLPPLRSLIWRDARLARACALGATWPNLVCGSRRRRGMRPRRRYFSQPVNRGASGTDDRSAPAT